MNCGRFYTFLNGSKCTPVTGIFRTDGYKLYILYRFKPYYSRRALDTLSVEICKKINLMTTEDSFSYLYIDFERMKLEYSISIFTKAKRSVLQHFWGNLRISISNLIYSSLLFKTEHGKAKGSDFRRKDVKFSRSSQNVPRKVIDVWVCQSKNVVRRCIINIWTYNEGQNFGKDEKITRKMLEL